MFVYFRFKRKLHIIFFAKSISKHYSTFFQYIFLLVWPEERRVLLEKLIRGDGNALSFQIYQDLAGRFVKGTTEERTKLIFKLMKDENVQTIKVIIHILSNHKYLKFDIDIQENIFLGF